MPNMSGKELIEIFSTFLANIQKDYTERGDTLTAHMLEPAKAKKEMILEITCLGEEISTFM
jgi:hypothetical protein